MRRGDFFLENESTTYDKRADIVGAGGASSEITTAGTELGVGKLVSTSVGGTDSFSLGSDEPFTVEKFPFGIPRLRWDNGYTMLHALGLGSNSTFINSLMSTGLLASRVWSIYWGHMWVGHPIDGSVVLGGYDKDKVIGRNYTGKLDYDEVTGCWTGMKVTVSDIQVNFRDGRDVSIFPPNLALPCCIVPQRQLLMEVPRVIRDNFEAETGTKHIRDSFGLHWSAIIFNANEA